MIESAGPNYIRRLVEADRAPVMELIAYDRVMGSLVHSFIVRRGLESSQEFWGLFAAPSRLDGLFTLDQDGRSTVLGGGFAYAGLIAGFMRERTAAGGRLAFIDAPRETAAAIAAILPPAKTESLGVWAHEDMDRELGAPQPEGLCVRRVDPARDAAGLQRLYEADETFREIGVNTGDAMEAVRRGLRLMLVGELCSKKPQGSPELVSAAFGWLTDLEVARVSGVVTHPDCRSHGYATAVVGELTRQLLSGGRRPFLYVSLGNAPAVRVYEHLGYRPHAVVDKLRYGRMRY